MSDAAEICRKHARAYARKLMKARLARKGRGAHWMPCARLAIRLAREIEAEPPKDTPND